MDATPAGMVDLYHSLLICGVWATFLGLQALKTPRWLQLGVPGLLALLLVANWFWPQHIYVAKRLGRPASIALDLATVAFMLLFFTLIFRKQQPSDRG
jgi:hypothetical protein